MNLTRTSFAQSVAEPPELCRLKCVGHHHKGNTGSNALQTEQFLVCRVTSRYNHRISDRTSIPRTKASLEILQPYIFYNTGIAVITISLKHYYRSKLSKNIIQDISLKFRVLKQQKENTTATTRRKKTPS